MISVIIPTLNEEQNIKALLAGLAGLPDLDVLVSDGGSRDQTLEFVREAGVRYIVGEAGRGRQLRAGVQAAEGDLFVFVHADSLIHPEVFPAVREAAQHGKAWGCCTLEFTEKTLFFRLLGWGSRWRARLFSSCYGDQGLYCTREFYDRVGGFPDWRLLEDLEFSRRARRLDRAHILPVRIQTSTRRFREKGMWRTWGKMQAVKLMYVLGFPLERIRLFYEGQREDFPCPRSRSKS